MASRRPAARSPGARRVATAAALQLQLHIELRGIKPPIWRRVLVPENVTLGKLHVILQMVMGWTDSHLHEYEIEHRRYGIPDDEWPEDEPVTDERRVRLNTFVDAGVRRLTYVYDFGDHWEHIVKVENVLARPLDSPLVLCVDGANRCPPEDVGGTHGYAEFLHVLQNPRHEEYTDTLTWAGGPFDPAAFSIAAVNGLLATIKR
jgi:hypothetical protein